LLVLIAGVSNGSLEHLLQTAKVAVPESLLNEVRSAGHHDLEIRNAAKMVRTAVLGADLDRIVDAVTKLKQKAVAVGITLAVHPAAFEAATAATTRLLDEARNELPLTKEAAGRFDLSAGQDDALQSLRRLHLIHSLATDLGARRTPGHAPHSWGVEGERESV
jgi:hypothetical protein